MDKKKKGKGHARMLLVHMQKYEAQGLDYGQGGATLDEETGLRSYKPWQEMIKRPDVQEVFNAAKADEMQDGHIDPPISQMYKENEKQMPPWEDAPGDHDPTFADLAAKGRNGDDIMVWLPEDVAVFFGKLKDGLTENPKTGLLEFGGGIFGRLSNPINSIIRVGGTIAGGMVGGPLGAGFGNMLAGMATGQKFGDSMISGLKNGAYWYGGQHLAGLGAGAGIPGMAGLSSAMGPAASLSSLFGAEAAAPAVAGAAKGAAAGAAGTGAAAAAPAAAAGTSGLLGAAKNLMTSPVGLAGMGIAGLKFLGDKKQHGIVRDEADRQRQLRDEDLRKYGIVATRSPDSFKPYPKRERNPEYGKIGSLYEPHNTGSLYREKYAHGGQVQQTADRLIRGPGDGQADKINTSIAPNTYIVPADAVSMAGNGSTDAGAHVLEGWVQKMGAGRHPQQSSGRGVPVALSDGEFPIPAEVVTGLGSGNPEKGSHMIKKMIENMRIHKGMNRGGLSPKAKPLDAYMMERRA